jgi:hypothetical protein
MSIKDKLVHAATRYDERESKKAGYNPYALGQYFARIDEVSADIERGADPRAAIVAGFNGRLASAMLKAIGQGAISKGEATSGSWCYAPVSKGGAA